jgi:uncharacterized protein YceK
MLVVRTIGMAFAGFAICLFSGCGSMVNTSENFFYMLDPWGRPAGDKSMPQLGRPYGGVLWDAYWGTAYLMVPFTEPPDQRDSLGVEIFGRLSAAIIGTYLVIDLPFSFVLDTLCLPEHLHPPRSETAVNVGTEMAMETVF